MDEYDIACEVSFLLNKINQLIINKKEYGMVMIHLANAEILVENIVHDLEVKGV